MFLGLRRLPARERCLLLSRAKARLIPASLRTDSPGGRDLVHRRPMLKNTERFPSECSREFQAWTDGARNPSCLTLVLSPFFQLAEALPTCDLGGRKNYPWHQHVVMGHIVGRTPCSMTHHCLGTALSPFALGRQLRYPELAMTYDEGIARPHESTRRALAGCITPRYEAHLQYRSASHTSPGEYPGQPQSLQHSPDSKRERYTVHVHPTACTSYRGFLQTLAKRALSTPPRPRFGRASV